MGHVPVGTTDQNSTSRVDALTAEGAAKVFIYTYTGKKMSRPEFDKAFDYLRPGGTLVVIRLNRLER